MQRDETLSFQACFSVGLDFYIYGESDWSPNLCWFVTSLEK